jgi:hypothetical protein
VRPRLFGDGVTKEFEVERLVPSQAMVIDNRKCHLRTQGSDGTYLPMKKSLHSWRGGANESVPYQGRLQ